MSKPPIKLVTKPTVQHRGVLETLKNVTALVESEAITGIAIAAVDREGFSHSLYESGDNIGLLIGSLERLKYRLLIHQDQG